MNYFRTAAFAAILGSASIAAPAIAQSASVDCRFEKATTANTLPDAALTQLGDAKLTGDFLANKAVGAIIANGSVLLEGAPAACRQAGKLKQAWLQANELRAAGEYGAADLKGRPFYLIRYIVPAPAEDKPVATSTQAAAEVNPSDTATEPAAAVVQADPAVAARQRQLAAEQQTLTARQLKLETRQSNLQSQIATLSKKKGPLTAAELTTLKAWLDEETGIQKQLDDVKARLSQVETDMAAVYGVWKTDKNGRRVLVRPGHMQNMQGDIAALKQSDSSFWDWVSWIGGLVGAVIALIGLAFGIRKLFG